MARVVYLPELGENLEFPPVDMALEEGILCFGGDLSIDRLLLAYRSGIFPWYSDEQPIIWWAPDPRAVMFPAKIRISHTVRKIIKKRHFSYTKNTAFAEVISHCASVPRFDQEGTWITHEMQSAYIAMHHAGHAHSYEVWKDQILVGGLYGVKIGNAFFGESMFSLVSNASKVAFAHMIADHLESGITLCDCQVANDHTLSLGAVEISRAQYLEYLQCAINGKPFPIESPVAQDFLPS